MCFSLNPDAWTATLSLVSLQACITGETERGQSGPHIQRSLDFGTFSYRGVWPGKTTNCRPGSNGVGTNFGMADYDNDACHMLDTRVDHSKDNALPVSGTKRESDLPPLAPAGRGIIHGPLKLATFSIRPSTGHESTWVEYVTTLIGQFIPLILVGENDRRRHGTQSHGMVKLPQRRSGRLWQRRQMRLIEYGLHKLSSVYELGAHSHSASYRLLLRF